MVGSGTDEKLVEHALMLITRAELEAPEAARKRREALERWRARSPIHEAACTEALRRSALLGGMADALRKTFEEPRAKRPGEGRRTVLRGLGLFLVGGLLLGGGGSWYWKLPVYAQAFMTGTAQQLQATLPDAGNGRSGSNVDLNARTAVEVRLYRHRRVARLESGDARFEVAPDSGRPFVVETRAGTVEVVGTVFTVSDRGGPVSVVVERGHVRFVPRADAGRAPDAGPEHAAIDLHAGEGLVIREGRPEAVHAVSADTAAAWRNGWLVFDNVRLDEAVPAINAFRTQPVVLADGEVAALRLTGRFRAMDSGELLKVLPAILPLRVAMQDDGSAVLTAR